MQTKSINLFDVVAATYNDIPWIIVHHTCSFTSAFSSSFIALFTYTKTDESHPLPLQSFYIFLKSILVWVT